MIKFKNSQHFAISAFTLAEILITLAIIGIVAALTIPSLLNKYQKRIYVTQLQKNYALLQQAYSLTQIDNGSSEFWDWNDTENVVKILSKYLKVEKFYPKNSDVFKTMCYEHNPVQYEKNAQYAWLGGTYISSPFFANNTASIKLNNGACIGLTHYLEQEGYKKRIFIDINGSENKPNVAGKDLFYFYINDKNQLKAYGDTLSDEELGIQANKEQDGDRYQITANACNPKNDLGGSYCAEKIIRENWQINYF